jgi:uncharacterized protein with LGFP repeats
MGQSASPLGLPVGDTRDNRNAPGRHNFFQHGAIVTSHATGTHAVLAPIYGEWDRNGREDGRLGLPVTDTRPNDDRVGRHSFFQHGAIYTHPDHGTHALPQPEWDVWRAHLAEAGPLGYPRQDQAAVGTTGATHLEFERGTIDVHPTLGAHAVWGPIFTSWAADYGREAGSLGFPVSDVRPEDDTHDRCDFEHGSLVVDTTTGEVTLIPPD